jgi:hypothetical protein
MQYHADWFKLQDPRAVLRVPSVNREPMRNMLPKLIGRAFETASPPKTAPPYFERPHPAGGG